MAGRIRRGRFLIPTSAFLVVAICITQTIFVIRPMSLTNLLHNSLLNKDLQMASQTAGKLAWYRPDDVDLIFQRADLASRLDDKAKAAEILKTIPERSARAASAQFARALILRDLYQLDAAELSFKQALRSDSQMLEARRSLVGLMGIERRETDQLTELWSWHQSGVSVIEPLRLIAQSVVVIPPGTLAKTIDEGMVLEKSVQAEPENPHVRPALARYYRNRGEVEKALGLLDNWLKTHQEDVPGQIERLFCLVEAGELESASLVISKAPEAWRKSANFWIVTGDHQRNQSQWQEAVQAYEQALLIDSRQPETYYRLAECKRALGLGSEAAKLLEQHASIRKLAELAASVDPNTPEVSGMMAVANHCRSLNRDREARAWAMEVLRLDRNHSEARSLVDQVKP